jgi:hypothetical protein
MKRCGDVTTGERLAFIEEHHQDGMVRLKRLFDRKGFLMDENAYGERFTERQFDLVFQPLLDAAFIGAQILAGLSGEGKTVGRLAKELSLTNEAVFDHLKELLRKNMVEIHGSENRHPIFRKR